MSYIPLALRYRPKNLADVIGQDSYVRILDYAIRNNRISNAYLFTGTRGVGKTTLARILSKLVNCQKPLVNLGLIKVCGACTPCMQSNSADIVEIDAASNTGVDNIRSLIEDTEYVPMIGSHKIYIIDEVHMLSKSAFNALLKTLEEPKNHVIFFMATTEPEKVPITVLSRCQRFDLKDISPRDIKILLQNIATENQIPITESGLQSIAIKANGSARDALMYLDQLDSYIGHINQACKETASAFEKPECALQTQGLQHIDAELVSQILQIISPHEACELFCNVITGNIAQAITQMHQLRDLKGIFEQVQSHICQAAKLLISHETIDAQPAPQHSQANNTNDESQNYGVKIINTLRESLAKSENRSIDFNRDALKHLNTSWKTINDYLPGLQLTSNKVQYSEMLLIQICANFKIPDHADVIINKQQEAAILPKVSSQTKTDYEVVSNPTPNASSAGSIKTDNRIVSNDIWELIINLTDQLNAQFQFEVYYFLLNNCEVNYLPEQHLYTFAFKNAEREHLDILSSILNAANIKYKYITKDSIKPIKVQLIKDFETTKLFADITNKFNAKVQDLVSKI